MSRLLFVFPGQGSQYVKMGKALYDSDPAIRDLFHEANDHVGQPIQRFCFEGPESMLHKTQIAQLGIFIVSVAYLTKLKQCTIVPTIVAGHSLGELTAYHAAGVYDFTTGLDIIQYRGQIMADAYPSKDSAMIAVMGMDAPCLESVVATYKEVVIANYNSPNQWVLSGTQNAITGISEVLKTNGAKRIIPLPVSGAFHSPFMTPAVKPFADYLKESPLYDAEIPIVLNRTAQIETKVEPLRENLSEQIHSPVQWAKSIHLLTDTVDAVYEVGPKSILTGLIRKISPTLPIRSCTETLAEVL